MDFDFLSESITPQQTTVLTINTTGGLALPSGSSGTRSATAAGTIRWNTDTTSVEYYNGFTWSSFSTGSVSITVNGSTGLGVTGSPVGATGTLTLTLGTELQGLSGLSSNGMVTRTTSGTYTSRTITGTSGNITVTNGDGVSGNPTIDLATAGTAQTNYFGRFATDAYGRVTGFSSATSTDITTALGYTPVSVGGSSMTSGASITFSGGGTITGLPTVPSGSSDAVSKAYVDSIAQGLDPKASVRVATVAAGTLATSFENGQVVDTVTLVTGDRILIKNQAAPAENGIYIVQASGAPVRATDMDAWTEVPNVFVFVEEGGQADTGWVCTSNQGGTLNTTSITWVQFAGAGTYTAGTGISITGTTISLTTPVATGNGGTGLSSIGTANQVLGVNSGATGLEYKSVSQGTGITVTHAANSITITNAGVTQITAGTAIGISGGTGNVTINNTGVTSIAGTANQITASGSTGGVTLSVPNTFIAPGTAQITGALYQSSAVVVSAAGTNQGTATALAASYNVVTTVGSGEGVSLPSSATAGWEVTIVNKGANALTVYPNSGAAIDAGAANAGFNVPVNDTVTLINAAGTQWYTTMPVDVAGTGISLSGGTGNMTITNTGVTSVAGTINQINVSGSTGAVTFSLPSSITITGLTLSGLTANSFLYSGVGGALTTTTAPTNGQLLIGSTGAAPVAATLTQGTGISISNAAGSITIANTGVTSVGLSLPGIFSVSGSPVTTTGTLTASLATQNNNTFFAGPTTGGPLAPTFRAIAYGDLPIKLYNENSSTPTVPSATGTNAVAIGSGATASATNGVAIGDGSAARVWGGQVHANGRFATDGDAQAGLYVLRNITTDATGTELYLDGTSATQRLTLPNNSAITFDIYVVARRTDATGGTAGYRFNGIIKRDATAATTAIVGSVSKTVIAETNVSWDATCTADTTNGSIKITVTGEAAKTIRWVAQVQTTEVTN